MVRNGNLNPASRNAYNHLKLLIFQNTNQRSSSCRRDVRSSAGARSTVHRSFAVPPGFEILPVLRHRIVAAYRPDCLVLVDTALAGTPWKSISNGTVYSATNSFESSLKRRLSRTMSYGVRAMSVFLQQALKQAMPGWHRNPDLLSERSSTGWTGLAAGGGLSAGLDTICHAPGGARTTLCSPFRRRRRLPPAVS